MKGLMGHSLGRYHNLEQLGTPCPLSPTPYGDLRRGPSAGTIGGNHRRGCSPFGYEAAKGGMAVIFQNR